MLVTPIDSAVNEAPIFEAEFNAQVQGFAWISEDAFLYGTEDGKICQMQLNKYNRELKEISTYTVYSSTVYICVDTIL